MLEAIHTILDVLAGRRNLAPHEADVLHEALSPGYTTKAPTADELAAAQAVLARATPAPAEAAAPEGGLS
jgi:hypothetical protein